MTPLMPCATWSPPNPASSTKSNSASNRETKCIKQQKSLKSGNSSKLKPGTLWYPLVPFGTLWYPLVPFGTLWYPLVPFGTLWYPLVPSTETEPSLPGVARDLLSSTIDRPIAWGRLHYEMARPHMQNPLREGDFDLILAELLLDGEKEVAFQTARLRSPFYCPHSQFEVERAFAEAIERDCGGGLPQDFGMCQRH